MILSFVIDLLFILMVPFNRYSGSAPEDMGLEPLQCVECHEDILEKKVGHYPAEDDCFNCHESTGVSHPSVDSAGFRLMDKLPDLCFICHEEISTKAHTHQPVARGNCLGCHDPHGSPETSLLHAPDPELCLLCHNRDYHTDSTETLNISQLVLGNMRAHSAIAGGGCMSCHLSHGSDYRVLLVDRFPRADYVSAKTENFELCFLCHDTDLMEARETESGTGFRNGKTNLHWIHINGKEGRNCRMCHNIHGSIKPFLIEERVGFGSWEMSLNFLPDEQGGSCLPGCHAQLYYKR